MDRHAFATWLHTRRALLVDIARRIVGSRAEAEDIVQDLIVAACAGLDEAPRSAAAWATTAIRNAALDRLRHRHVATRHAGSFVIEADSGPSTEDVVASRLQVAETILRIVHAAGEAEAAALLLQIVFDVDHASIARRSGKSAAALRVALHRARRRVRDATRPAGPDERRERDRIERVFAICREAVEQHDAAMLWALIPDAAVASRAMPVATTRVPTTRIAVRLVAGRHSLVLMQGAGTLCALPVVTLEAECALVPESN